MTSTPRLQATFEPNGEATPETRAAVYAEYLRLVALQLEPVAFFTIHQRVLESFGATEEQINWEISWAHFVLCSFHLIDTNTIGKITANTMVWPTPYLSRCVWADARELNFSERGE